MLCPALDTGLAIPELELVFGSVGLVADASLSFSSKVLNSFCTLILTFSADDSIPIILDSMEAILLQFSAWLDMMCSFLTCIKDRFSFTLSIAESRASNLALCFAWHAEMPAMAAPLSWLIFSIFDIFSEQLELAVVSHLILSDISRIGPFSILPSNSVLKEFSFSSISLPTSSMSPCVGDTGALAAGSFSGE